ncbi:MAG: helix-turn-helix transcriptional regulator [Candidatus Riflebacteria bacterium]|nr:helix-turn-helix transcriptional regulator [Candidatus Riflebacteria bacterium]
MRILSTKEVSAYLNINEKKIYQLVKDCDIPFTRLGGKIIFAQEIIDRWIHQNTELQKNILISGSDDLLFREIIDHYNRDSSHTAFCAAVGSVNGIKMLKNGRATMSCVHIADQDGQYSLSFLDRYLNRTDYVVMRLFNRKQGVYLLPDNPHSIKSFKEIFARGLRFANRNQGSGTRILVDQLFKEHGINVKPDASAPPEAQSHVGAAMKVLSGEADASFGIQNVSEMLKLKFIPVFEEPFNLIVPAGQWESRIVRDFVAYFEQTRMPRHLQNLPGYDISEIGKIIWKPESLAD